MGADPADGARAPAGAEGHARPQIRVLPDELVDQIAAGEVVERPASVVKELVENALDAGATHVAVEVEAGGKSLIRVLDNGWGMAEDELRLAITRHATSKLQRFEDLYGLATMGFRGEALPSIAAVSRMTITSRPREQLAGRRLVIEGGRIAEVGDIGAPVGTRIEVRDLLFNVPARQKFLKGDATEASHVTDAIQKLALAHPGVHFRLAHGARTALDVPHHPDVLERARAVLGTRLGRRLHRVAGEEGGVRVEALLAAPELSQTTSRGVQLLVGRRAIKDRGLLHAINMGYGELVPKGRYPVAILFVDAPDGAVDINVHPQKLEVRFSDPQAVYAAVRHVIRRGVAQAPWLADRAEVGAAPVRLRTMAAGDDAYGAPASRMAAGLARETARAMFPVGRSSAGASRQAAFPLAGPSAAPAASPGVAGTAPRAGAAGTAPDAPDAGDAWPRAKARARPASNTALAAGPTPTGEPASQPAAPAEPAGPRVSSPDAPPHPADAPSPAGEAGRFFSSLRYLGQLDRAYLVCEADGEMVLIDQHAAHERVAFERLRQRYAERTIAVQRLLFPHRIELEGGQAAVATDERDTLAALGFELEPFGGESFAIKTVPAGVREGDAARVLLELLDDLGQRGGSRAVEERLDLILATLACHSVVRAGDALSEREVAALLCSMDGVDFRAHCPHGRPVLLRISTAEIARRFGR